MYYSNPFATLKSDPNNTFDFYFNMSGLTIGSEGAGQDISGIGTILNNGREFYTSGNSWKVLTGFPSYSIIGDGSQILEMEIRSSDCGEIGAIKFDTNNIQEDSNNYRWCGTQTNWGIIPDKPYSGSGNWEDVYAILNDFSETPTHIHLPIDDDADSSGDIYYKDIRIRKYVPSEPTFVIFPEQAINTTVLSLSPSNNLSTGDLLNTFTCNVASSNSSTLSNVSLYGNWSSGWGLKQTNFISGNINSSSFNVTFPNSSNKYLWNCLVQDISGSSAWYKTNYTIEIDKTTPEIILNSPIGIISDVTPTINVSFNENVTAWFNINNENNISLCNGCTSLDTYYLHLSEGVFSLNIYANDSYGNINSLLNNNFSIDMNQSYYDNFNDNSSLNFPSDISWNKGNVTYSGGGKTFYNGIEIGYQTGNLNFFANQWGGSANFGEFDITCPGGDSACWFLTQNGTNITSINIQNGVALEDSTSTVGFLMYSAVNVDVRFNPDPHPQNGDNIIGVCYILGQWFYDDNNGCDEPFTPLPSDILLANITWGTSISRITASNLGGVETHYFKAINTTKNITQITNITWTEINSDTTNNISVQISVDNGNTFYNATNGGGITNITPNNSLIYAITFRADGSKSFGISDIEIFWEDDNFITPTINLTYPTNNLKILADDIINLSWMVNDDSSVLSCNLYLNGIFNQTKICSSNITSFINISLKRGNYNWSINVLDPDNLSVNSSTFNFTIIEKEHKQISKNITNIGTNLYKIDLFVENKINNNKNFKIFDFVNSNFNYGSFNPLYNWLDFITGFYNGSVLSWNLTINPLLSNHINYSITSNTNKNFLLEQFIVGLE